MKTEIDDVSSSDVCISEETSDQDVKRILFKPRPLHDTMEPIYMVSNNFRNILYENNADGNEFIVLQGIGRFCIKIRKTGSRLLARPSEQQSPAQELKIHLESGRMIDTYELSIEEVDELPSGSSLENHLHPKRQKVLVIAEYPTGSWASFLEPSTTEAKTSVLKHEPDVIYETVTDTSVTPKASKDDDIESPVEYESDDEEEPSGAVDNEYEPNFPIPRSLRVYFDADEDTPHEAELAGRVDIICENCTRNVEHGKNMLGPKSLFDFDWQQCPVPPIFPHLRRETFVGSCGPLTDPISSPYEAFSLIWDRPIMEYIALQTNLYAQEYANQRLERGEIGPSSRITNWKDTDADELYNYFAVLMAMGIINKTKLEDYWSIDKNIFSTPGFTANMGVKRFQLLSRCLQFNNNANISSFTRSQKKIYKVQQIVDHLNTKFSSLYSLGQNIVIDESLSRWKVWLDTKQLTSKKTAKRRIETYDLCDSKTGYLWRFECRVVDQEDVEPVLISGSIPNIVLRLLRGLENRGHTVWMDSYFHSPALARILKSLGYDCVGTLRTNRQFMPETVINITNPNAKVGQICGCTSGDVDIVICRDKHLMTMISTYHGLTLSEDKPALIKDYISCMDGVDKKDQMISAYLIERKQTQIWYKKFLRRVLNVSAFNAYVLYKHTHDIKHRDFRIRLVTEILKRHQKIGPNTAVDIHPSGLTNEMISHFPVPLPVLPGGEKAGKQRRKCVFCKTKRSHYICIACNVALCFPSGRAKSNCFIIYHT